MTSKAEAIHRIDGDSAPARQEVDWPAAHSMDTTWFAVDEGGFVAVFDTDEGGALPNEASHAGGAGEPSFDTWPLDAVRLAKAIGANPSLLSEWRAWKARVDASPAPVAERKARKVLSVVVIEAALEEEAPTSYRAPDYSASAGTVEERHPEAQWKVLREAAPRILTHEAPMSVTTLEELGRRPDVVAVIYEDYLELLEDEPVFHYGHAWEGAHRPGLYARQGEAPRSPMHLDDVPEPARAEVARLRLPIRFADTAQLQLADYLSDDDCSSWAEDTSLRGEPRGAARGAPRVPRAPGRRAIWIVVLGILLLVLLGFLKGRAH